MPKCPFCGEEIDELMTDIEEVRTYRVYLDSENGERLEWESVDAETVEESNEYSCPACGAQICHGYNNAVSFLKGEQNANS